MQDKSQLSKVLKEVNAIYVAMSLLKEDIDRRDYVAENEFSGLSEEKIDHYEKSLAANSKLFTALISKYASPQLEQEFSFQKTVVQNQIKEASELIRKSKLIYETIEFIKNVSLYVEEVAVINKKGGQNASWDIDRELALRIVINDNNLAEIRFNESCHKHFSDAVDQYWSAFKKRKEIAPVFENKESSEVAIFNTGTPTQQLLRKKLTLKKIQVATVTSNENKKSTMIDNSSDIEKTREKKNNQAKNSKPENNPEPVKLQEMQTANEAELKGLLEAIKGNFSAIKLANHNLSVKNYTDFTRVSDKSIIIYEALLNEHSTKFSQIISGKNISQLEKKYGFKKEEVENKLTDSHNLLEQAKYREMTIIETLNLTQQISVFIKQSQEYTQGVSNNRPDTEEENKIHLAIEGSLDKIKFNNHCHEQLTSVIQEFKTINQTVENEFNNMLNRDGSYIFTGYAENTVTEETLENYPRNTLQERLKAKIKNKETKRAATSQVSENISEPSNESKEQKGKEAEEALKKIEKKDAQKKEKNKKKKQAKKKKLAQLISNEEQSLGNLKNSRTLDFQEENFNAAPIVAEIPSQVVEPVSQEQKTGETRAETIENERHQTNRGETQTPESLEKSLNTVSMIDKTRTQSEESSSQEEKTDQTRVVESQEKQSTHSEATQETVSAEPSASQEQKFEETSNNAPAVTPKKMSTRNRRRTLVKQTEQLKNDAVETVNSVEKTKWNVPWEDPADSRAVQKPEISVATPETVETEISLQSSQDSSGSQPIEKSIKISTYGGFFSQSGPLSLSTSDQVQEQLSQSKSEFSETHESGAEKILKQDGNNFPPSSGILNNNIESSEEEESVLLTPEVTYYRVQIKNPFSDSYDEVLMPIKEGFPFYSRREMPNILPDPLASGVRYDFLIMRTRNGAYKELYAPIADGFQIMTTFQSNFFPAPPIQRTPSPEESEAKTQTLKSLLNMK